MKLDRHQREHIADMFKDSANVILASLVIGQVIENSVRWLRVIVGLGIFFMLVVLTTLLRKGGEKHGRA
jgi:hypothetical protein